MEHMQFDNRSGSGNVKVTEEDAEGEGLGRAPERGSGRDPGNWHRGKTRCSGVVVSRESPNFSKLTVLNFCPAMTEPGQSHIGFTILFSQHSSNIHAQ